MVDSLRFIVPICEGRLEGARLPGVGAHASTEWSTSRRCSSACTSCLSRRGTSRSAGYGPPEAAPPASPDEAGDRSGGLRDEPQHGGRRGDPRTRPRARDEVVDLGRAPDDVQVIIVKLETSFAYIWRAARALRRTLAGFERARDGHRLADDVHIDAGVTLRLGQLQRDETTQPSVPGIADLLAVPPCTRRSRPPSPALRSPQASSRGVAADFATTRDPVKTGLACADGRGGGI